MLPRNLLKSQIPRPNRYRRVHRINHRVKVRTFPPSHPRMKMQFFELWIILLLTRFLGSRSLTKSALNDLSGPKKQMLERYLNEGLEEDPAVVFARTQAQR